MKLETAYNFFELHIIYNKRIRIILLFLVGLECLIYLSVGFSHDLYKVSPGQKSSSDSMATVLKEFI